MGLGAFPAPHQQWLGMLGMHGTRAANYEMDEADLICAIGARFDDRITGKLSEFAPRAKFIHLDIDPAEISKNVPAHIPIVGDVKKILPKLTREYRALEIDSSRLDGWWQRIQPCQELATCVVEQIPVKIFLMNNGVYGMVRQWQELFWERRYSSIDMGGTPDWVKLADAFGAVGMRVTHKDEVTDAFETAMKTDGPVLVDVRVTREENCYPMIPAGQAARDMVG